MAGRCWFVVHVQAEEEEGQVFPDLSSPHATVSR
jgi:hypothetical protein